MNLQGITWRGLQERLINEQLRQNIRNPAPNRATTPPVCFQTRLSLITFGKEERSSNSPTSLDVEGVCWCPVNLSAPIPSGSSQSAVYEPLFQAVMPAKDGNEDFEEVI
jgi:hypothetical protein